MLLKNFCMAISAPIAGSGSNNTVLRLTTGEHAALTSSSSYIGSVSGSYYDHSGSNGFSGGRYKGIILGTGTTPPTYSDYRMENYNTGLTYSNATASWSAPNVILTESATNNTDADIIVSEVGVFGMDANDNQYYQKLLYTRNVIEPVTIKPGETKTFTVKINFDKFSDAYSVS